MEFLCKLLLWIAIFGGITIVIAFSILFGNLFEEDEGRQERINWRCTIAMGIGLIVGFICLVILTATPLHTYGWYID